MDIQRKYIAIFHDLNVSEKGLLGFTLHNRYNLSPSDVISFIMDYQKKGYISCDKEYRIKITKSGREALLEIEAKLSRNKMYRVGSDYFDSVSKTDKIAINHPYIPDVHFRDKIS